VTGYLTTLPLPVPLDIPIRLGRDQAAQRAAEELAKAKYGGAPDWLLRLGDRGERFVDQLLDLIFANQLGRGSGGISPGLVIVVVTLLTVLALLIWRVGLPRWLARREEPVLGLDATRAAADYRSDAEAYAAAGDWTLATRDRFRAMVRELEVRTILDVRPARTATEAAYAASRALPDNTEALRAGAELFNAVVYGERVADRAAYTAMTSLDETVTAAADMVDLVEVGPVGA
jgi:hypothetical protein